MKQRKHVQKIYTCNRVCIFAFKMYEKGLLIEVSAARFYHKKGRIVQEDSGLWITAYTSKLFLV